MVSKHIALAGNRLATLLQSLKTGDILCGKVGVQLDEERYVVHFQGNDFIARYNGSLKRGAVVRTAVLQTVPQVVLKIVDGEYVRAECMRHVAQVKDCVKQFSDLLIFKPYYADAIDVIVTQGEALVAAYGATDKRVAFLRDLIVHCRDMVITSTDIRHKGIMPVLVFALDNTHKMDPLFLEACIVGIHDMGLQGSFSGNMRELELMQDAVKKLYAHSVIQRHINEVGVIAQKGIFVTELAYYDMTGYENIHVYMCRNGAYAYDVRVVFGREKRRYCDFFLDRDGYKIVYNNALRMLLDTDLLVQYIRPALEKDCTLVFDENLNTIFDTEYSTFFAEIDVLRPVTFNVVA